MLCAGSKYDMSLICDYRVIPVYSLGSGIAIGGWGMSDPEVRQKLLERVARNDAAEIGQFVPQILKDHPKHVRGFSRCSVIQLPSGSIS
jgi:hypothetical protein